jgi:predicted DNA-binding ribbon-helix-helix protein
VPVTRTEVELHAGECISLQHKDTHMKSPIVKRSIVIGGHKTSVSLEDAFWRGLKDIARAQRMTLSTMVGEIDKARHQSNLSSAIRLFVLDRLCNLEPQFRGAGYDRRDSEPMVRQSIASHV